MVNVNFTLLVELGLFLVFLGLMHRFVLQPLVALLDRRETQIEGDLGSAQQAEHAAEAAEAALRSEIATLHRRATREIAKAHRKAQEEHAKVVADLKHQEAGELARIHASFVAQLDEQRAEVPAAAEAIAGQVLQRLGLGGDAA